MKLRFALLLLSVTLPTPVILAQTKTPVKPLPKTSKTTATKTTATKTSSTTKPTTGRVAAPASTTRTTKPTSAPVAKPATTQAPPSPAPTVSSRSKLEIPGVADQKAPSFAKGTVAVNLGVGLGIGYGYGFSYGGKSTSSPALSLSAEKGILDGIGPGVISVGGLLGYKSDSYEWDIVDQNYKATWTNVYVAARGAYHYNFTDNSKVDTYAGVSLAARIEKYSNSLNTLDYDGGGVHLETGIFVGGRYMVTDKLGAFTELGYDMSYIKLGLTTKF